MSSLRIGMLTPSSNTVLEPVTSRILAGLADVSVHFSRFRVTAIGLDPGLLGQFDDRLMLRAAELLADAKVDVISWNGTSAGWLGLDTDRRLCERIRAATGIPASTSVLALFDVMRRRGERRLGLVTPYTDDVQQAIAANFAREGVEVVAERHLGISDNFSFALVDDRTMSAMVDDVAAARPDAIAIFCTNLAGADLVAGLEARHDIAVHDSIATAVYGALDAVGRPMADLVPFGRLFATARNP
ncbi:MAG: aspartate/glutamate racemase family protein [Ancalomicrobiaceae bacterium]|nr:aspartate/glutamate racemase family protein [Ancalomicrobiaceae bacterium]